METSFECLSSGISELTFLETDRILGETSDIASADSL